MWSVESHYFIAVTIRYILHVVRFFSTNVILIRLFHYIKIMCIIPTFLFITRGKRIIFNQNFILTVNTKFFKPVMIIIFNIGRNAISSTFLVLFLLILFSKSPHLSDCLQITQWFYRLTQFDIFICTSSHWKKMRKHSLKLTLGTLQHGQAIKIKHKSN